MDRGQVRQGVPRAQQLQTTARPTGVTPTRAAPPPKSGLMQVAEALTDVAPQLHGFLEQRRVRQQQQEAEQGYDAFQTMRFEDAQRLIESGEMKQQESPYFYAAFAKQFGLAHAARRRRQMQDYYINEFDKDTGNIDDMIARFAGQDHERFAGNEWVMSGYREGMGSFFDSLRDTQAEFKTERTAMQARDRFFDVAGGAIDRAIEEGGNPSEYVRELYAGHHELLGIPYADLDDTVMQLAKRYAEQGDVETVRALLETPVTGADGQKVGAFTNRARYADEARGLIASAEAAQGQSLRRENTYTYVEMEQRARQGQLDSTDLAFLETQRNSGAITQAQHESILNKNQAAVRTATADAEVAEITERFTTAATELILEGKGYAVTDANFTDSMGREHSLSASEIRQSVVNQTLDTMRERGRSVQEMAGTLAGMATDAGYEFWENILTDGHLAMNNVGADQALEGGLPPAASAAMELWMELGDQPRLRNRLVKDAAGLQVYQDAEALIRGGIPQDNAMAVAASIDRSKGRVSLSSSVDRQEFERAVKRAVPDRFRQGPVRNGGQAARAIEETARILMDAGVPMSRAISVSRDMFQESHVIINQVAINTRNMAVPDNFEDIAEAAVAVFAEQVGERPRDLALAPYQGNENHWVIIDANTGLPHPMARQRGGLFHIQQLQKNADEVAEGAAHTMREDIDAAIARNAEQIEATQEYIDSLRPDPDEEFPEDSGAARVQRGEGVMPFVPQ